MKKLMIINGPNLNMTGKREPDIYGSSSLDEINAKIKKRAEQLSLNVEFFQSNSEGEIIDAVHKAYNYADGIIINPGAYSHYSLAIADALRATGVKIIEVHMSNVFAREDERHNMTTAKAAAAVISGLGEFSYILALEAMANALL